MFQSPIPLKVVRWLRSTHTVRILHLFDHSCNLLNQNNALIACVTPTIGLGPFSLIIPEFVLEKVHRGASIQVECGRLEIGDWGLGIEGLAVWDAVPDWAALKGRELENGRFSPLAPPIQHPFDQLLAGLHTNDQAQIKQAAYQLAGLGEGLTPTGDDLLMGVIYALWVYRPDCAWIRLIGETAVSRTTTLSAAFLQAAIDGEATIHWHDLAQNKSQAIEKILSIGHTSGRDAWTGFVQANKLFC